MKKLSIPVVGVSVLLMLPVSAPLGAAETLYRKTSDQYVEGDKKWFANGDETIHIKYVGETKNELPHGKGTMTFKGHKYAGEYKDGKKNGWGTYTFPSGEKYVGEFKDNNFHGRGIDTMPSGLKYAGEFKNGLWDGWGTLTFPSGEKYVGERKENKRHGYGVLILANEERYVGEWKNDRPYVMKLFDKKGDLITRWFNGTEYGEYSWDDNEDKFFGVLDQAGYLLSGTLTYAKGSKFVGEFKDGKYYRGTYYYIENNKLKNKTIGEFNDRGSLWTGVKIRLMNLMSGPFGCVHDVCTKGECTYHHCGKKSQRNEAIHTWVQEIEDHRKKISQYREYYQYRADLILKTLKDDYSNGNEVLEKLTSISDQEYVFRKIEKTISNLDDRFKEEGEFIHVFELNRDHSNLSEVAEKIRKLEKKSRTVESIERAITDLDSRLKPQAELIYGQLNEDYSNLDGVETKFNELIKTNQLLTDIEENVFNLDMKVIDLGKRVLAGLDDDLSNLGKIQSEIERLNDLDEQIKSLRTQVAGFHPDLESRGEKTLDSLRSDLSNLEKVSKTIQKLHTESDKKIEQEKEVAEQEKAKKELRETLVLSYAVYQVIKYCYQIREGYAMVYVNDTEMANAKKQVKTIENTITSMIEVDTDAAWKESIEGATKLKKVVDLDIALANTPNWDQCDMFLLALEEESVKYGMKPESEKKDF